MEYTVEVKELGKKTFIAYGREHDFEDSIEKELELWDQCSKDKTIDRLKAISKSDIVYGIFCYRYNSKLNTFSYHIACEIKDKKFETDEFETIFLYPSTYAVFKIEINASFTKKQAYEKLNEIYWGKWLPDSGYISMIEPETNASIEGTAAINIFSPYELNADKFTMEIWFPISKKQLFS